MKDEERINPDRTPALAGEDEKDTLIFSLDY